MRLSPPPILTNKIFFPILSKELAKSRFLDTKKGSIGIESNSSVLCTPLKPFNSFFMTALKNYLIEAIHEMKKVTWPTKKQTTYYSAVVVILSITVALFFGLLDYFLNLGLSSLIS